ncbi:hypothetical protein ID866_3116 [Astraeus odoratus]|nr:hypothetical protein ID866_3116 [Astraeus odoratus]
MGLTVLAFYVLIYPPNYPQIADICVGLHLLEMAKTAWNAIITTENAGTLTEALESCLLSHVRKYFELGRLIIESIGPEGDMGGPLTEIEVLHGLLKSQEHRGSTVTCT